MNNLSRAGVSFYMHRFIPAVVFLAVLMPSAWAASPDRDSRRDEPRVIVYQHADYRGDSLELYPGDSIENFSGKTFANGYGLNDQISSVRVEGGAEVYFYENARYRGAALRLTENTRDLTGRLLSEGSSQSWNDRISSLKVEGPRRRHGNDRNLDYNAIIKRAYQDMLGRQPDEGSLRSYRNRMIDQGWTERMVRDDLKNGDEFRREGADRIINRAYQDILGRGVDPSGLQKYRREILERNWTESDVRDDLRRSIEYKNRAKPQP